MIPAGEVVTEVPEGGKRINPNAVLMPAVDYSSGTKTVDQIVRALKSGDQKLSALERLVRSAGCVLLKPYGVILENSGKAITISQLISFFGINTTSNVKCPICAESFPYDTILFHLESTYQRGHKLKSSQVTKLFERRWYNWDHRGDHFYDGEEKIEKIC